MGARRIIAALMAWGLSGTAQAAGVFFHMQGEPGQRQAFFADTLVMDRTPVSEIFGPTTVNQLDVVVIYESPQKPEWAEMRLQFRCMSKVSFDGKKLPKPPGWNEPVQMRLGEDGYSVRRVDLQREPTPAGNWQTVSSPVLLKAHKLACNRDEVNQALRDSVKGERIDQERFKAQVSKVGLTEEMTVLATILPTLMLDVVWGQLWKGSKRPDPSGLWSTPATPEKRAQYERQMAEINQQFQAVAGQLRSSYEARIKAQDAAMAFDQRAAKLRGGRELSRSEYMLIQVWQAKTEQDVVARMGPPSVTEAGGLRFLGYGQAYDNRVVVGNNAGAAWVEGGYANCDLQFVLMPDADGMYRVADVRVAADGSDVGNRSTACDGLLQAPGD
jgi:hypothetical protein